MVLGGLKQVYTMIRLLRSISELHIFPICIRGETMHQDSADWEDAVP
jgi:hypothetical protein